VTNLAELGIAVTASLPRAEGAESSPYAANLLPGIAFWTSMQGDSASSAPPRADSFFSAFFSVNLCVSVPLW